MYYINVIFPGLPKPYYLKYKPTTASITPTRSLAHGTKPAVLVGQSTERNEVVVAL